MKTLSRGILLSLFLLGLTATLLGTPSAGLADGPGESGGQDPPTAPGGSTADGGQESLLIDLTARFAPLTVRIALL
jgi:hypothetical protein